VSASKPVCQTLSRWLKDNLGKHCLGVLTSVDSRALDAAAHLINLYAYHPRQDVVRAFGLTVLQMQPQARYLAYHAIAHVRNWEDRVAMWNEAGLPPVENPGMCDWEPGGAKRP